ncbi:hypothetical protein HMI54_009556 [Coelomomyces lativittatus]|nr:hypothetical protein HMI54_009556 [Coelomomyces lativittatus]
MLTYPTPPPSANSETTMTHYPEYPLTNAVNASEVASTSTPSMAPTAHAPVSTPQTVSSDEHMEVHERGMGKKLVLMGVQYALDKYTKKNNKKKKSKLGLFRSFNGEQGDEEESGEDENEETNLQSKV